MVIVMNMATGKREKAGIVEPAGEEFGAFVDEVLNAGWLPQPEARLEKRCAEGTASTSGFEPDEFLRNLYRHQEG
ncbi:MAG: hypothetical protein ACK4E4_05795 [Rhodocyclaceae bacterium]